MVTSGISLTTATVLSHITLPTDHLFVSWIVACGSLGAFLSVSLNLQRLQIDPEAPRLMNTISAVSRIIIGMIGAVFVFLVIKGNLILGLLADLKNPAAILAIAVLAGFSETFVPNALRGWDKKLPSQILGALPKRSWVKRLRRMGQEVLVPLWRHVQDKSPSTLSRWQWTWVFDDSVFKKYGQQLGLVGHWWSGQEKRVRPGIDGVLLVVVIGDGQLVVPVDFAIRRPDPTGPGAPCRTKLGWVQGMLDACLAALHRRGLRLPPPMVIADSWFGVCMLRGRPQSSSKQRSRRPTAYATLQLPGAAHRWRSVTTRLEIIR